jgi:hypothetical protein
LTAISGPSSVDIPFDFDVTDLVISRKLMLPRPKVCFARNLYSHSLQTLEFNLAMASHVPVKTSLKAKHVQIPSQIHHLRTCVQLVVCAIVSERNLRLGSGSGQSFEQMTSLDKMFIFLTVLFDLLLFFEIGEFDKMVNGINQ